MDMNATGQPRWRSVTLQVRQWWPGWRARMPGWIAQAALLVGAANVVWAVVPRSRHRLGPLVEFLPDSVAQTAVAANLVVGLLLVVLATGLRRRKRDVWAISLAVLVVSAVAHAVLGHDWAAAAVSVTMTGVLVAARAEFVVVGAPVTWRRAALAFAALAATNLGVGLVLVGTRHLAAVAGPRARLEHVVLGMVGLPGPVGFAHPGAAGQVAVSLAGLGLLTAGVPLLMLLRVARPRPARSPEQDRRLRALIAGHGEQDSLAYFALRADKSVVFSASGKAAIGYRVVGGVCLASGDPLGDPEAWPGAIRAWLAQARRNGWAPAVLGCSERAARAFAQFGLDALEMGDEAVVDIASFDLSGRAMRAVRQADSRIRRAGHTCTIARVRDLPPQHTAEITGAARRWRGGQSERGFSMASGRLASPADPDAVLALARDRTGRVVAVLQFVPWGPGGLSLDAMLRDRQGDNGVLEFLVVALIDWCRGHRVARLSLNFAVARSVFARGERIGAGPVLRVQLKTLRLAGRWCQLESLYRANAKYQPAWVPRYLVFPAARVLPRVAVAALRAEAFLPRPTLERGRVPAPAPAAPAGAAVDPADSVPPARRDATRVLVVDDGPRLAAAVPANSSPIGSPPTPPRSRPGDPRDRVPRSTPATAAAPW